MSMSHLLADSTEELEAIAAELGLKAEWMQHRGEPSEHYDVSQSVKRRALKLGAVQVKPRDLVAIIRARRGGGVPSLRPPESRPIVSPTHMIDSQAGFQDTGGTQE